MVQKFEYKRATMEDIDELVRTRIIVLRAANKLSDDEDMSVVEEESKAYYGRALETGEHIAYLVYDNGAFVGAGGVSFYQVMPTYHNPTGKKAYIMNMYTAPEYRRQGIAINTLDLLVKDAKEQGVLQIALEATDMGRPLYERYGFVKMDDDIEYIHIIYSGTCIIEEEDYWGNRSIMDVVLRNQVFGISYAYANIKKYPVSLVAKEKTKVIIIPVSKVFSPCSKHCVHHNTLIKNAVEVLAIKNISLMEKLEHISKRTTREKIISFLSSFATKTNSNDFYIPFDRQELADYLLVDRSALSSELSKLKKSNLIDYHKNHFIINYENKL